MPLKETDFDRFSASYLDVLDELHEQSVRQARENASCADCRWSIKAASRKSRERVEKAFDILESECLVISTDARKSGDAIRAMCKAAALAAMEYRVCMLAVVEADGTEHFDDAEAMAPDDWCELWEPVA